MRDKCLAMKHIRRCLAFVLILCLGPSAVMAQQAKPDPAKHEQKVRDMVAFLEYVLNTLGNSATSARDKDVLIRESYSKIFRDDKVQIEDDLDETRKVITNKDVQAYLKDVDFFFENVAFEFNIRSIKGDVNANEDLFYKVSIARNLKGTTVDGKQVNKTIPRYIEINFNPDDQDLRIVSIYTNEFDESKVLQTWWNELSYEWQSIFKKRLTVTTDSLTLDDIRNIISIDSLDISNNEYIQTIEPLAALSNLISLNLSQSSITDVTPIRNLTGLAELNLSGTQVQDISALKYADKLVHLRIDNTPINDISVVGEMPNLEYLDISATGVLDISPLASATSLKHLNMQAAPVSELSPLASLSTMIELNASQTLVRDIAPLSGLKKLESLSLDSTYFQDISPLASLESLKVVSLNYTSVSNLRPLMELGHLERIYCDHTGIGQTIADDFMASRPGVLVIFDSEDLQTWWSSLTAEWRNVLSKTAGIGLQPTKEELARVTNLDSINVENNLAIQSLEPLERLQKLEAIVAGKTVISDLSPIRGHKGIRLLDISNTRVEDISTLKNFKNLTELHAANSKIQNIDPLLGIPGLKKLYVDQTAIHELHVQEFLNRNPGCLVVYKTRHLENWWSGLSPEWQQVFEAQVPIDKGSKEENLHRLVELEKLDFANVPVNDLSPLSEFIRLRELQFSGTAISDLSPLATIVTLKSLHATNSPVREIDPLDQLVELEDLDISNTPVDDLSALADLQNLKSLNCSGTQVDRLDRLEDLTSLESLDCSNTRVRRLDAVSRLSLKTLKCYNTGISEKRVEDFASKNPECNVVYYR